MTAARPTKTVSVLTAVAVAVAIGALCGYFFLGRVSASLLRPGEASVVVRGEAVYAERCASCHGRNLEGQPDWRTRDEDGYLPAPPHDETGHTWHHPDRLLFAITREGLAEAANLKDYQTRMPAFGNVLDDGDIVAVLSYVKSRWPDEIQRRHDELNRAYARRKP